LAEHTSLMPSSINLADLGRRIHAARIARRMTLEEVVSRTDFTVSWLSKIENGLLAPSLEGLVRLAEVLECGLEHLVGGLSASAHFVVDRDGEGRIPAGRDGRGGLVTERLAESWRGRGMEPAILHVSATGSRKSPEHYDGQRFLYILEGDVKIHYGDELIVLGPGDSIYLDASLPHAIMPADRGTARILSVIFEPARNGHTPQRASRDGQARRATTGKNNQADSARSRRS
jgi:transcriptional regulator with XRE-family HTH domain